jgi:hypothetical protein
MSSLRHTGKRDAPEAGDVEAQTLVDDKKGSSHDPPQSPLKLKAVATDDSFNAPPGASRNPVFLAKIIFRKVVDLARSGTDEDDIATFGGFIALIRDVITGVVLGILTISVIVFLDHHNIVHLQSAHNLRNNAFALVNDPETLATIEESSGLKFMLKEDYSEMLKKIEDFPAEMVSGAEKVKKQDAEIAENRKRIEENKPEHERIMAMANTVLELDKYCGTCRWEGRTTCDERVDYLKSTYGDSIHKARVGAMRSPSCKKEAQV